MSDRPQPADSSLLTGSLPRTLLILALPVLAEQFLNFCVGFVDTLLAGHLSDDINVQATGAIGVASYVGWLASMLFSVVAAGTTALVSRARGAGDVAGADRVTNRSLALATVCGLVIALFVYPSAPWFAWLLQMDEVQTPIAVRYLRLDGIGYLFTSISLVGSAALRGCGNMRTPLLIFGSVSLVNLILSPALVYGWGPLPVWGIDGIVAGTIVARVFGGVMILVMLAMNLTELTLDWHEWRLRGNTVWRILRIGIPAAIDGMIMWSGHFLFLMVVSSMGEVPFAVHIIGIRIEALTYLPAVAWGAAAATMIGQSLGAGDPERARQAGREAARQCCLLGVAITVAFCFGADFIYRAMHSDSAVREMGTAIFPMVGVFQIPLIMHIIYVASLRGAGETRVPLWITVLSTWGIRLPGAYVMGIVLGWGLTGAWLAMCLDMLIRGLLARWKFHQGRWATLEV